MSGISKRAISQKVLNIFEFGFLKNLLKFAMKKSDFNLRKI